MGFFSRLLATFWSLFPNWPSFHGFFTAFKPGIVLIAFHGIAIAALALPKIPDRFQIATLSVLLSIPLFFASQISIEASILKQLQGPFVFTSFIPIFMLFFSWGVLGLEAERTPAQLAPFRWWGRINAKIQKSYDSGAWRQPFVLRWANWSFRTKLVVIFFAVAAPPTIFILAFAFMKS